MIQPHAQLDLMDPAALFKHALVHSSFALSFASEISIDTQNASLYYFVPTKVDFAPIDDDVVPADVIGTVTKEARFVRFTAFSCTDMLWRDVIYRGQALGALLDTILIWRYPWHPETKIAPFDWATSDAAQKEWYDIKVSDFRNLTFCLNTRFRPTECVGRPKTAIEIRFALYGVDI